MEASPWQRNMHGNRGMFASQEAMHPSNLQRYSRKGAFKLLKKKVNTATSQETSIFWRLKREMER